MGHNVKVVILTPSGIRVEFGPDEEVRFPCTENGVHKVMLCGDDDRTLYCELHPTQHTDTIYALPANKWKVELS
jgi:hypothetical protein